MYCGKFYRTNGSKIFMKQNVFLQQRVEGERRGGKRGREGVGRRRETYLDSVSNKQSAKSHNIYEKMRILKSEYLVIWPCDYVKKEFLYFLVIPER